MDVGGFSQGDEDEVSTTPDASPVEAASLAVQDYLTLVLSDSNLPTGGFVASSGLESYWAHGLLRPLIAGNPDQMEPKYDSAGAGLVDFLRTSLDTYARSVAGFVMDTHALVQAYMRGEVETATLAYGDMPEKQAERVASLIEELDDAYHVMLLNHVAQRASKAQGVALLTLYAKSFAPSTQPMSLHKQAPSETGLPQNQQQQRATSLLRILKSRIRLGTCHGHLPVCWAAFMAALGISEGTRVLEVHLFLQARAILSSAVRLNIVGPYQMHRLLAFDVKGIIDRAVKQARGATTALLPSITSTSQNARNDRASRPQFESVSPVKGGAEPTEWEWTWPDDGAWAQDAAQVVPAPTMTWPLGDLIQARHDQLHSRLFNS